MKQSLVARKQISLVVPTKKAPLHPDHLVNTVNLNKPIKTKNSKIKEWLDQPNKRGSKDQQWMIEIFESKRNPKVINA